MKTPASLRLPLTGTFINYISKSLAEIQKLKFLRHYRIRSNYEKTNIKFCSIDSFES